MRITPIPCLSDNYAYLLVCPETKAAAIVDVSEPGPVLRALEGSLPRETRRSAEGESRERVEVVAILSTHHHHDHVGGNVEVKRQLGVARVYGYASDRGRIPEQTELLEDGATFAIGKLEVTALHVPGHTLGAVAYHVRHEPYDACVFTGDTLFLAGAGKLFEGDPPTMTRSLEKLAALDGRTRVYCGHEYTESNLRFAAHVEPSNAAVTAARERVASTRAQGRPTVPGTIAEELAQNPFLRTQSEEIRRVLGIPSDASPAEALGAIRAAKDRFR